MKGDDMAQAHAGIEIAASADTVWQLIGGFGSLPGWLPCIPASALSEGVASVARVDHGSRTAHQRSG
ncbi:SRPBCC family protein [Burkholderia sp. 1B3(2022)]|uniref:SRPBCC family protein n=1 Tax=Burkholderia sp. 1B3(2022) TaxID=2997425 RepID=UPI003FA5AB72